MKVGANKWSFCGTVHIAGRPAVPFVTTTTQAAPIVSTAVTKTMKKTKKINNNNKKIKAGEGMKGKKVSTNRNTATVRDGDPKGLVSVVSILKKPNPAIDCYISDTESDVSTVDTVSPSSSSTTPSFDEGKVIATEDVTTNTKAKKKAVKHRVRFSMSMRWSSAGYPSNLKLTDTTVAKLWYSPADLRAFRVRAEEDVLHSLQFETRLLLRQIYTNVFMVGTHSDDDLHEIESCGDAQASAARSRAKKILLAYYDSYRGMEKKVIPEICSSTRSYVQDVLSLHWNQQLSASFQYRTPLAKQMHDETELALYASQRSVQASAWAALIGSIDGNAITTKTGGRSRPPSASTVDEEPVQSIAPMVSNLATPSQTRNESESSSLSISNHARRRRRQPLLPSEATKTNLVILKKKGNSSKVIPVIRTRQDVMFS